jgi:hypothetical protein
MRQLVVLLQQFVDIRFHFNLPFYRRHPRNGALCGCNNTVQTCIIKMHIQQTSEG